MTMDDLDAFREKLRTVFDVCDERGLGYISVERFQTLAQDHFGAEDDLEITGIVQLLDPDGKGKISFDDFCHGVQHILQIIGGSKSPRSSILPMTNSLDLLELPATNGFHPIEEDRCVTPPDVSEVSTYNEYDLTDEDVQIQNELTVHARPVSSEEDRDSALSGPSSENHENRIIDPDEAVRFEDYGAGDSCDELSGSDTLAVGRRNHRLQVSLKSSDLRRNSSGRSTPEIRRINRPRKPNNSRNNLPDAVFDDIDGNFVELNDRVRQLQSQLVSLTDNQMQNDDRRVRLREDNLSLREKIHILEEQLRDAEYRTQEKIQDEQRKAKESLTKQERDHDHRVESLTHQLHRIQREHDGFKDENPRLKEEIEKLRKDNYRLQESLTDRFEALSRIQLDYETLKEKANHHEQEVVQENRNQKESLADMSKELWGLRAYREESERAKQERSPSFNEMPTRYNEMLISMRKLKTENASLRDQNEDLQASLLNRGIEEGRSLLTGGGESLAAEFEQLSKDELMDALTQEKEDNMKLREYVDRIILKIVENNPALLEKK